MLTPEAWADWALFKGVVDLHTAAVDQTVETAPTALLRSLQGRATNT